MFYANDIWNSLISQRLKQMERPGTPLKAQQESRQTGNSRQLNMVQTRRKTGSSSRAFSRFAAFNSHKPTARFCAIKLKPHVMF